MLTDEQLRQIDYALEMLLCAMRAANWEGDAAYSAGEKARALLAAHSAGAQEPIAYLHEMHMEGDQIYERLTFDTTNAFGEPGRDYDASYKVTCTSLYAQRQPMTDAARGIKRWREKIIQAMRAPSRGDFTIAINAIVREMTTEIERLDRAKGE